MQERRVIKENWFCSTLQDNKCIVKKDEIFQQFFMHVCSDA